MVEITVGDAALAAEVGDRLAGGRLLSDRIAPELFSGQRRIDNRRGFSGDEAGLRVSEERRCGGGT